MASLSHVIVQQVTQHVQHLVLAAEISLALEAGIGPAVLFPYFVG